MKKILFAILFSSFAAYLSAQTTWYNPMESDVPAVFGRAWNSEIGNKSYARMPERMKNNIPSNVYGLAQNSAGLSIRFITDSRDIVVKYTIVQQGHLANMTRLNESGVDLYAVSSKREYRWVGSHMKYKLPYSKSNEMQMSYLGLTNDGKTEYVLYLPSYNTVTKLEIGVNSGSAFNFLHPTVEKPIVVYGSSIIQGASASRPGLTITSITERNLRKPFVNLAFSGSCMMEPSVFNALAEIDAAAFVIDPVPNSFRLKSEDIMERASNGIKTIRKKSNAPIVLVENYEHSDSIMMRTNFLRYQKANEALRKAYLSLIGEGVRDLYLLDHSQLNLGDEGMIEGVHPNDLGNKVYANAYTKTLRRIVGTKTIAHRGYWDTEGSAQNSIRSLMKADSIQTWGSEFDVWITKDGKIVVNHDADIQGVHIETSDYEDLKDLKLKNGERLPLLEDYLAAGKDCKTKLILEIKSHKDKKRENKCVDDILKLVKTFQLGNDRIEFISFSLDACKRLHKKAKDYNIAYLSGDLSPKQIKELGFSGIDYHYSVFSDHPQWIQESHDLGLTVNAWTVNKTSVMEHLIRQGVDFLTTNKPEESMQLTGEK